MATPGERDAPGHGNEHVTRRTAPQSNPEKRVTPRRDDGDATNVKMVEVQT